MTLFLVRYNLQIVIIRIILREITKDSPLGEDSNLVFFQSYRYNDNNQLDKEIKLFEAYRNEIYTYVIYPLVSSLFTI